MSLHQKLFNGLAERTAMSQAELSALAKSTETAKLNFLTDVVYNLEGSYKPEGIRRWFNRPRVQLGGEAPQDILSRNWTPEDPKAGIIRRLSETLRC